MNIISFLFRGTELLEKSISIVIIAILFFFAMPTFSNLIEYTKHNKLISVKSNISSAVNLNNILTNILTDEEDIELTHGYPTAQSITKIVDFSNFVVSYHLDYMDIRVKNNDKLFLRYLPNENGLSLKIIKIDQM